LPTQSSVAAETNRVPAQMVQSEHQRSDYDMQDLSVNGVHLYETRVKMRN
jgi:hypothetical protein